ncbi:MAG: glutaredoxin family protein [Chloroflexota bacterium]|nr:glutaredoxin family protein [Chloroflexota bacterium]
MIDKKIVMYSRSYGCPFITLAKRVLHDHALPYDEIMIDKDGDAKERVLEWTGFLSVPTIIVAPADGVLPIAPPTPLARGASPRGIDRDTLITEPAADTLLHWLTRHGFVADETGADGVSNRNPV